MASRRHSERVSALCYFLLSAVPVSAHMEMSWPYPLHSKFNPLNTYQNIDYSMTSPLSPDGSNFPCKGYQNDRPVQPVVTYAAGSTYNMTLAGSATHHGGSCQISLSYDNGATFRVIKSMIGGCPLVSTYDFTIPSYAPSGNALLSWTWQNEEGNREFYQNCAEVSIVQGAYRRRRRQAFTTFDSLPYIWKANLEGVNDCATIESTDPVYPNAGPDVIYSNGVSSSSPPSVGACDSPTPYGQTYQDLGDSTLSAGSGGSTNSTAQQGAYGTYNNSSATTTSAPAPTSSPGSYADSSPELSTYSSTEYGASESAADSSDSSSLSIGREDLHGKLALSTPTPSTTTVTVECDTTVTITVAPTAVSTTIWPPTYMTSVPPSACTGTAAICPCAAVYGCQLVGTCLWQFMAQPISQNPPPRTSSQPPPPPVITPATTAKPPPATTSPSGSNPGSGSGSGSNPSKPRPPYATGDLTNYLPCVPGTFICTSSTTWKTCNYNDGTVNSKETWVYVSSREVAAGMECLPNLSAYASETKQYGQQANAPNGQYRDDRIVRARPDGDCDTDGSLQCTDGGQQFSICDHGGWVRMGAVAAGTTCKNGGIIAA